MFAKKRWGGFISLSLKMPGNLVLHRIVNVFMQQSHLCAKPLRALGTVVTVKSRGKINGCSVLRLSLCSNLNMPDSFLGCVANFNGLDYLSRPRNTKPRKPSGDAAVNPLVATEIVRNCITNSRGKSNCYNSILTSWWSKDIGNTGCKLVCRAQGRLEFRSNIYIY